MDELAIKLNMDPVKLRSAERAPEGRRPQPALLFAPHGGVSERGRREIRLVTAHAASRVDEERRLDPGLGSRRLLLDRRAHGQRSRPWTCATMAPPASPALPRISAPVPTPSFRKLSRTRRAFPTTRSKSFSAIPDLPPGPISGGSWATASVIPPVLEAIEKAQQTLFTIASQGKDPTVRRAEAGVDGLYRWLRSSQRQVSRHRRALRADPHRGQSPRRLQEVENPRAPSAIPSASSPPIPLERNLPK